MGETALMWAAAGGHTATVQMLLEAKADANAQNNVRFLIGRLHSTLHCAPMHAFFHFLMGVNMNLAMSLVCWSNRKETPR